MVSEKLVSPDSVTVMIDMVRHVENNDFSERAASSCRFIHSTLGLVTEVEELSMLIAQDIEECSVKNFGLKFKDEIGDIIFYLLQGMDTMPSSIPEITPIDFNYGSVLEKLKATVGEVADILKKYLAYDVSIPYKKLQMWYHNIWSYLHLLARDYCDTTLEECIAVTVAKLSYRYPENKFRYEDRQNRSRPR